MYSNVYDISEKKQDVKHYKHYNPIFAKIYYFSINIVCRYSRVHSYQNIISQA